MHQRPRACIDRVMELRTHCVASSSFEKLRIIAVCIYYRDEKRYLEILSTIFRWISLHLEISWRVKYMWYYDKDINGKVRETIYLIISFGIIKRTRYIVSNFGKLRIIVACIYWRDEIGYFKILLIFYWFWMKYCVKSLYLVIISFENLSISNTYKSKTCFSW